MNLPAPVTFLGATFAVALVAAGFDLRTRRIPNVLTLGALVLAFPLHALVSPTTIGLQSAGLGLVACGFPALVAWRLGMLAGGDVKLMAAMGAVGGISFGVETVFLSLFCAVGFVILRICWKGELLRMVGNGFAVAASRTVRRTKLVLPDPEYSVSLRFGPFALAGAGLSLFLHGAIL